MAKNKKRAGESAPVKKKSRIGHILLRFLCAVMGFCVGAFLYIYNMLGGFMFVDAPVVSEED